MSEHASPRFWLFAATALLAAGFGRWAEATMTAALGACDLALSLAGAPTKEESGLQKPGRPGELELLERRTALPAAVTLGALTAVGLLRFELEITVLTVAALAVICWPGGLTELARSAAASPAALERGLRFLPVCALGVLLAALLATLAGMPLPLLPLQILWLALLSRALLLTLARVPASRRPSPPGSGIAGEHWGRDVLWAALVISALALFLGRLAWQTERPSWRTVIFTTFVFSLIVLAMTAAWWGFRRSDRSRWWPLAIVASNGLGLQLAFLYLPGVGELFETVPLQSWELAFCSGISLVVTLAIGSDLRSFRPSSPRRAKT